MDSEDAPPEEIQKAQQIMEQLSSKTPAAWVPAFMEAIKYQSAYPISTLGPNNPMPRFSCFMMVTNQQAPLGNLKAAEVARIGGPKAAHPQLLCASRFGLLDKEYIRLPDRFVRGSEERLKWRDLPCYGTVAFDEDFLRLTMSDPVCELGLYYVLGSAEANSTIARYATTREVTELGTRVTRGDKANLYLTWAKSGDYDQLKGNSWAAALLGLFRARDPSVIYEGGITLNTLGLGATVVFEPVLSPSGDLPWKFWGMRMRDENPSEETYGGAWFKALAAVGLRPSMMLYTNAALPDMAATGMLRGQSVCSAWSYMSNTLLASQINTGAKKADRITGPDGHISLYYAQVEYFQGYQLQTPGLVRYKQTLPRMEKPRALLGQYYTNQQIKDTNLSTLAPQDYSTFKAVQESVIDKTPLNSAQLVALYRELGAPDRVLNMIPAQEVLDATGIDTPSRRSILKRFKNDLELLRTTKEDYWKQPEFAEIVVKNLATQAQSLLEKKQRARAPKAKAVEQARVTPRILTNEQFERLVSSTLSKPQSLL